MGWSHAHASLRLLSVFYAGISTNKVKINVSSWVVCSAEFLLYAHLHFHLFFPSIKEWRGIFPIGQ